MSLLYKILATAQDNSIFKKLDVVLCQFYVSRYFKYVCTPQKTAQQYKGHSEAFYYFEYILIGLLSQIFKFVK